MAADIEKDSRIVTKREDGKIQMVLHQIHAYDQSNVNAMINSWRNKRKASKEFIGLFQKKYQMAKKMLIGEMDKIKRSHFEWIQKYKTLTDKQRAELANKMLEKELTSRQNFIKDYDEAKKEAIKKLDEDYMAMKQQSVNDKLEAQAGLDLWEEHYQDGSSK